MTTHTLGTAFIRRAGGAASVWYAGHLFSFLAESDDTGGQFSLIDARIRRGLEPPPHTHQHEDELFVVLEGQMIFTVGGKTLVAGPGDAVFLPRGIQHGFELGTSEARALIWMTPAGLEAAFRDLSEPAEALTVPPAPIAPPDVPRLLAIFNAHEVAFAPPPDIA